MRHGSAHDPLQWIEVGKRWLEAQKTGTTFAEFCKQEGFGTSKVAYHIRKLGFRIRAPKPGLLRGQLCDERNDNR